MLSPLMSQLSREIRATSRTKWPLSTARNPYGTRVSEVGSRPRSGRKTLLGLRRVFPLRMCPTHRAAETVVHLDQLLACPIAAEDVGVAVLLPSCCEGWIFDLSLLVGTCTLVQY